jgi:hypothetical protein
LIDSGKLTLLVPEVVDIEFSKFVRNLSDYIDAAFDKIGKALDGLIKTNDIWNESSDVVLSLKNASADWKKLKLIETSQRISAVRTLLEPKANVVVLPLTQEVMYRSRRRMLAGLAPNNDRASDADCFIIETLLIYFTERNQKSTDQFLLCCENVKDFAIELQNNRCSLHPRILDEFPASDVFRDLASLIAFINVNKEIHRPKAEEIKEAVQRNKRLAAMNSDAMSDILRRAREFAELKRDVERHLASLPELEIPAEVLEQQRALRETQRMIEEYTRPHREMIKQYEERMRPFQDDIRRQQELLDSIKSQSPPIHPVSDEPSAHEGHQLKDSAMEHQEPEQEPGSDKQTSSGNADDSSEQSDDDAPEGEHEKGD